MSQHDSLQENGYCFAHHLKELRRRIIGKQICLSHALGCSNAAVSLWESGKRLPHRRTLPLILDVLAKGGASATDLDGLRCSWQTTRLPRRNGPGRQDNPYPITAKPI
jgi:hypothetical protein